MPGAIGRQVAVATRSRLEHDEVLEIPVAVGESPGHVAVAARDDRWDAGQAYTRRRRAPRPRRRSGPGTRCSARAGRGACRWRPARGHSPYARPASAQLLLPSMDSAGHSLIAACSGPLRSPGCSRTAPDRMLPQVDLRRLRQRHARQPAAVERRLPFRVGIRQQPIQRRGQRRGEPVVLLLAAIVASPAGRSTSRRRRAASPRRAKARALPRSSRYSKGARTGVGECRIHAVRIGVEQCPFAGHRVRQAPAPARVRNWCRRMRRSARAAPGPAVPRVRLRRCAAAGPSGRGDPAHAQSRSRARRPRGSRPRITGTPCRIALDRGPRPRAPATATSPSSRGRLGAQREPRRAAISERQQHRQDRRSGRFGGQASRRIFQRVRSPAGP